MHEILIGGFSEEIGTKLQDRLQDVRVRCVERGEAVIDALAAAETSLLILDHRLDNPPALEVLAKIHSMGPSRKLAVIYCLSEGSGAELVKRLARDFGVDEVVLPPVDTDELGWKAARLLGIARPSEPAAAYEKIETAVAAVRSRFMGVLWDRVSALEQAGAAALEGNLNAAVRASAGREAHKLAGLLGTIGFAAGSRYAREIEEMLAGGAAFSESHALRLSELLVALRLDLEKTPLTCASSASGAEDQFSLLIVDHDPDLVERMEAEAATREWHVESVSDFSAARRSVEADAPDVILLDPHLSGNTPEGLALLEEMSSRSPSIPVIVLTSRDTFTDRVEVARRGGRGFLSRCSPTSKIVEAVSQLASRVRAENTRILAVDDDPGILAFVRSLLEPRGLRIGTLEDPLQFWQELETFAPDLLLLDVDMPCLSGIELCRVVRNDPRWAETPVLFLTRHDDPETVDRVFSAGADDFVPKPIVGPELVTRVVNRLEQSRLRRSLAETDSLTGVSNRTKFSRTLTDFLELCRRQAQPLAFALISLDGFKEINYRYGHSTGDVILQKVADLLRRAFRSEDVLGRWNGCEFAAGMYGLSRYDGVQRMNDLLAKIRKERFKERGGADIDVRFSAAVAEFEEDGSDLQSLYRAAENALREAQKAGGGKVVPAGWMAGGRETQKRLDVALIMKDEAQASLLTYLLDDRGCRTRWLRDGKSAARLLRGSNNGIPVKVAVIDLDLPGIDGLSLLKRMGAASASTRAIVLTSPTVSEAAQTALEMGAFDCIAKPLNPAVAAQHICRALNAR